MMTEDHETLKKYRALMADVQHIVLTLRGIYREIDDTFDDTSPGVRESALCVARSFINSLSEKMDQGDALLNQLSVKIPPLPEHLIKQPSPRRAAREAMRARLRVS